MFIKVLRDFARPHWLEIILLLKRSQGLPVAELAKEMHMSYMGVKQHCVEMERLGYLDTWRQPSKMGRPQKLYRLTDKVMTLFPDAGTELSLDLLDAVQETYGRNAPDKLLVRYFTRKTEGYGKRLKGTTLAEKAASLAKMRFTEGYLSHCFYDDERGLEIIEHHSLTAEIEEKHPTLARIEESMFDKLLTAEVEREVVEASGLKEYRFKLKARG